MQNVSKENERNLRQLILLPKQQQQENFSLLASSLRDTFNTVAVTMSVVALAVPKKLNQNVWQINIVSEKLLKNYERAKASKTCSSLDILRMNQDIFTQISPQAKAHIVKPQKNLKFILKTVNLM